MHNMPGTYSIVYDVGRSPLDTIIRRFFFLENVQKFTYEGRGMELIASKV